MRRMLTDLRRRGARGLAASRAGLGLAATALLLVLLAIAALGGLLDGRGPASAAQAPQGGAVSVALAAAAPARPCSGREGQRTLPADTELAVFERPQDQPDGLPALDGAEGTSWVPARTLLPDQVRRVGLGRFEAEVHIVPTLGVRSDGSCPAYSGGEGDHRQGYEQEGVCLTVGSGKVSVRCFTDEAIREGRAVALTGPSAAGRPADEVHGVVPDGVASVRLAWSGTTVRAAVVDNAFEARLAGVRSGERVTLAFSGPAVAESRAACRPSPALLDAVPALRGDPPASAPPEQLADVVDVAPGLVDRWARVWGGGDGVSFWVTPQLRCGVTVADDRACVATVSDEESIVEGAICADAATIRGRGTSEWVPVDERPVVAGFAPPGASAARIVLPDARDEVAPVRDGVFAAILDPDVRMDHPDAYRLSFER